jgi:hypothetical protein
MVMMGQFQKLSLFLLGFLGIKQVDVELLGFFCGSLLKLRIVFTAILTEYWSGGFCHRTPEFE